MNTFACAECSVLSHSFLRVSKQHKSAATGWVAVCVGGEKRTLLEADVFKRLPNFVL